MNDLYKSLNISVRLICIDCFVQSLLRPSLIEPENMMRALTKSKILTN